MQYFTEQAASHREALDLVRAKYGESAQVLSHKTREDGRLPRASSRGRASRSRAISGPRGRPRPTSARRRPRTSRRRSARSSPMGAQARSGRPGVPAGPRRDAGDQGEARRAGRAAAAEAGDHETIRRIDALLALNDFSEAFRREAVARLRRDFSLEALGDVEEVESAALEWVGDSIRLWKRSPSAARARGAEDPRPRGADGRRQDDDDRQARRHPRRRHWRR